MIDAQQWLEQKYPKKKRKNIVNFNYDIFGKGLEGSLFLEGFINLEVMDCNFNYLTELNIKDCSRIRLLWCRNSLLTNLELTNNLQLEGLDIGNNNFLQQDLSFLSHLVNLKVLLLGNTVKYTTQAEEIGTRINQGIYNRFYGSLKPLRNMTRLEQLNISNTDIDSGLEFLPDSLKTFYCSADYLPNSLVKKLTERLGLYGRPKETNYDMNHVDADNYALLLKIWKEDFLLLKKKGFNEQEVEQWTKLNLNSEEYEKIIHYLKEEKIPFEKFQEDFKNYNGNFELWKSNYSLEQKARILESAQSLFREQEEKINYLEIRISELVNLIKNQKKKIISDFSNVLPEKDLIQQLITKYLEFKKAEKQNVDNSLDLEEEYLEIKNKLKGKLGINFVKKLQPILSDCELLVNWEMELDERLSNKKLYIEEQKRTVKQITYNKEENQKIVDQHEQNHYQQLKRRDTLSQLELNLEKIIGKLLAKEEEINYLREQSVRPTYQTNISGSSGINIAIGDYNTLNSQVIYNINFNKWQLQSELSALKENYQSLNSADNNSTSEQKQLKKSILFLAAKQILATKRKETINSLIQTYQNLAKSTDKLNKVDTFNNYLGQINPLIGLIPVPGVSMATTVLNQSISFLTSFLKNRNLDKNSAKFEEFLIEDEKALTLLQETYLSLSKDLTNPTQINSLITNLLKVENNEISQHSVFTITNIKLNSELKEEDIKNTIESLTNHLKEFSNSLQSEITTYLPQLENNSQLQEELVVLLKKLNGEKEIESANHEQLIIQLKEQILQQENQLSELIDSTKNKLKSRNIFPNHKTKKTELYQNLFDQFLSTRIINHKLEAKVNKEKINLSEITDLQNSIKSLQEQLIKLESEQLQAKIEISSRN